MNNRITIRETRQSGLRIRAYVQDADAWDVFHGITFHENEIRYLMEVNDKISAIVLKDKTFIPILLPWQDLEQRLQNQDFRGDDIIDLTKLSGKVVRDVHAPKLAHKFNDEKEGIVITAILRKPDTTITFIRSFHEKDIASYDTRSSNNTRSSGSIRVVFNKAAAPQGIEEAMLDMPYDDYMKLLSDTKQRGGTKLDLCKVFSDNPSKYGVVI